eukprot:g14269.t1
MTRVFPPWLTHSTFSPHNILFAANAAGTAMKNTLLSVASEELLTPHIQAEVEIPGNPMPNHRFHNADLNHNSSSSTML